MVLNEQQAAWAKKVYDRIIEKERRVIARSGEKIPYTTENGVFNDMFEQDPDWWTNCFWHGILWLMYLETEEESIRSLAERLEIKMRPHLTRDVPLVQHDIGFMWLMSSVANYRITGNNDSKNSALLATQMLASRFNPQAGFITAWNSKQREGWSIIDSMMNLPLLYWASKETGYERYKAIGMAHADKTMNNAVRPDGSVAHIVEYDVMDGHLVQTFGGQGYAVGSSWTRGQAWALYGFIMSWMHTGEQRYMDTAKRVAHYFLAASAVHGYVPPVDFRSPAEPVYYDTTAGAIAACGLLEIAKALKDTHEADLYLQGAMNILQAMEKDHADWSDDCDAILRNGSEAYPPRAVHMDIIYGDYYFIEAVFKLCGKDFQMC